jgi:hypothetical protein
VFVPHISLLGFWVRQTFSILTLALLLFVAQKAFAASFLAPSHDFQPVTNTSSTLDKSLGGLTTDLHASPAPMAINPIVVDTCGPTVLLATTNTEAFRLIKKPFLFLFSGSSPPPLL